MFIVNLSWLKIRSPQNVLIVQLLNRVQLFSMPWTVARFPCPSLSPRVCSNSCPLCRLCHPTISSSVVPLFSCPQSFPASGSSPVNQLFPSSSQSIRASASASVLPMNIQDWFPLGWTDWISLLSRGLSRVFSSTTIQKLQFFGAQPSLWYNFISHMEKLKLWLYEPLSVKVYMSLLFNILSRFVIAFLPRSKHLLISWRQSPSTVILEPKKIKSVNVPTFSSSICHKVMGPNATILVF